jgi:hypothetical protein
MRSWSTVIAAAAASLLLSGSLAGCGDGDEPSDEDTPAASSSPTPSESPSPSPSASEPVETATPTEDARTVVRISIDGDEIAPGGDRISVDRGEVLTLEITSDRAGELHVHSKPEQFVEFSAGTSSHKLTINAPGVVDVEEHETGHVVVQFEVQ